ncbi:hypothetical protein [Sorangium sp. So ce394]|uniref:hypothetical protein n=1 Tax=Sorangium sp. So ce394 TaxID=3133310 RepID=UPI003F5B7EF3
MSHRHPNQRVRLTLPATYVTRTITAAQVHSYLDDMKWVKDPNGPLPSPENGDVSLTRIVTMIAAHEGRSPGAVLADIADGKGFERWVRSRKTWPT